MKSADVRRKFIEFYKARGHVEVPSASLVPENDPTTLFTSSGMQPLVPYLLGHPHPLGTRIVDSQKCFRAQDIEEVGDNRHTTFFEMLGNWSFGDYFKKEQLPWIWQFLTIELELPKERLYVSVLKGDEESVGIWKHLGVTQEKIYSYGVDKNWWSRAGEPDNMPVGEPGGPDSEVFIDFGETDKKHHCHPNCDCGRFMEIANSVFMQYRKNEDGSLEELPKKNVDFGGGLERLVAATNDEPDIFKSDLFWEAIQLLCKDEKNYNDDPRPYRIIADHLKAAIFIIAAGVEPSNKDRGYILRRLIRRAALQLHLLKISWSKAQEIIPVFHNIYASMYPSSVSALQQTIGTEILKFQTTLERGLKEFNKLKSIDGKVAFYLFQTYGFPWEMTSELAAETGQKIDKNEFEAEFKRHQELSRTSAKGMFKGGLVDRSESATKLHTATHLLHAALRKILGNHVQQKGSNITASRLRFDFSHPIKLTKEEIEKVEVLVNEKIQENLTISNTLMSYDEAIKGGALAFFGERYPEKVSVYTIGDFSHEVCGGPHVAHTGILGSFHIKKEESLGAGVRRIYAVVE